MKKNGSNNQLVSVITPVFNSEKYLEATINSVLSQSYQNFELILVDDCSSDNSIKIIRDYAQKESQIRFMQLLKNSGAGIARNEAIKLARGRYIAFLDSDDYWHQDKLKIQLKYMQNKDVAMVFSDYYIISVDSDVPHRRVIAPKRVSFNNMIRNDYIGFLTLIYDTHKTGKIYLPEIRKRQDWAFKLNLLRKIDYAYSLKEPLAYYRVGNRSLSSNKLKLLKYNYRVFRKILGFSFIKSYFSLVIFLLHYFHYKIFYVKKI